MLVVLEGLPGAGKSTALHKLQRLDSVNIIGEIIGAEPAGANEDFYILNDVAKHERIEHGRTNIMDRNFVSTLCYNYCAGKRYGSGTYPYVAQQVAEKLADGLLRQPDLYIYLTCSLKTSQARQHSTNAAAWSDAEFLRLVRQFYREYFEQVGCRVAVIDTDELDADTVVSKIGGLIGAATYIREGEVARV